MLLPQAVGTRVIDPILAAGFCFSKPLAARRATPPSVRSLWTRHPRMRARGLALATPEPGLADRPT